MVPRLSAGWNGDPLQPLWTGRRHRLSLMPTSGSKRARSTGSTAFPPTPRWISPGRCRRRAASRPTPARCSRSWWRRGPAVSCSPPIRRGWPGRAHPDPIRKYLPRSYRESFLFTGPRAEGAVTDDSYHCAIKATKKPNPAFVTTPSTVSWGQIYAYCLRHHQLARRLGLVREASFPIEAGLFENGGFLYVDLGGGE